MAGVSRRARRRATAIAGSASSTSDWRKTRLGDDAADASWRARSCSSTGPATRCRCSIRRPARSTARTSSSRRSARRTYTYAEARWSETLPDWIGAHVNALAAIGGVPKALVPRQSQGRHHQAVALRARHQPDLPGPCRPITAASCCRRGYASRATRPRSRSPCRSSSASCWRSCATGASSRWPSSTRRSVSASPTSTPRSCASSARAAHELLETLERPALKALAERTLPLCRVEARPVAPDYHVEIADHYYSVPSRLIREIVEARITGTHGRDLPQGQAGCQPCALCRSQPAHHDHASTCRARIGVTPNGRRPG